MKIGLFVGEKSSRSIFSWSLQLFNGTHNFDMAGGNFHGNELRFFPLQFTLMKVWRRTLHSHRFGHSEMWLKKIVKMIGS